MQSLRIVAPVLRRNPRLINFAGGMHERYAVLISRAYNAKETPNTRKYKTKEERRVLVVQYVEKYQASNKGQLPGITVLRKEVGGSIHILREILQELQKEQTLPKSAAGSLELESVHRIDGISPATKKKKKELTSIATSKETEGSVAELLTMDACGDVQGIPKDSTIDKPDNDSDFLAGNVGARQRLPFHTADEADDDSDLAAPEYSELPESSSRDSLCTLDEASGDFDLAASDGNEASKRSSLSSSSKLPPQTQRFEMILRSLPASTTSQILLDTAKQYWKNVTARVFPPRSQTSKHACGILRLETESELREAVWARKEIVKKVELHPALRKQTQSEGTDAACVKDDIQKQENLDIRRIRAIRMPSNDAFYDSENAAQDLPEVLHKAEGFGSLQGQLNCLPRLQKSFGVRIQAVPLQINAFEIKEAMGRFGNISNVSRQRGPGVVNYVTWFKNEEAAKKALDAQWVRLKDGSYRLGRQANPLTTVVRLSSLSSQVAISKLKSTCESIASVAGLEARKGGIVDVHFNVKDTTDMVNIIDRLSNLKFGEKRLRAFPAPRFFCGKDPDNYFKPQDVQLVRELKDTVLKQVERNMEKLSTDVQDFRELLALKQSDMLAAYTKSLN